MSDRERIDGVLVVGGGYAGVHAALAVRRAGVAVTVLDPAGTYDFVPRLAAVAGGTAPSDDAAAPLSSLVERTEIATATRIGDGEVELADGRTLEADAVIVTAGAVPIEPSLTGLDHALPLRTSADAHAMRDAIAGAAADGGGLVVVGGGATGVQLAGAAAASHPSLTVTVVDRGDVLLASLGASLGRHAGAVLRDRRVDVRLRTGVERIDERGVELDDGTRLDGVVAWAAGFDARADDLDVEVNEDGRILVDDQLRVMGKERTFAAGDIAFHLDGDGAPLAMAAQIAAQAGEQAGKNAVRLVHGEPLRDADLVHRGWVLDIGGRRGVAEIGPVTIASAPFDRLAALLHTAVDLKHLFELGGLSAIMRYRPGASHAAA